MPMPAAAFKETAPLLVIVAWFVSSLSIRTVALFFTLLTSTAAPISTLALASEFFTVNCKASSLVVVAVMSVLALILTEPSGAGGVVGVVPSPVCCESSPVCVPPSAGVPLAGVVSPAAGLAAVITTFFPMVTLALLVLETTPTAAPRPKAEFFFSLSPPSLVPSSLSLTSWIPPLPSLPAASFVLSSFVSTKASLISCVGSTDFCSLSFSSSDFSVPVLPCSALMSASSVADVSAVSLPVSLPVEVFTVLSTVIFSPVILFSALISTAPAVMERFKTTSALLS